MSHLTSTTSIETLAERSEPKIRRYNTRRTIEKCKECGYATSFYPSDSGAWHCPECGQRHLIVGKLG